jgi:hypothetical protein
MAKNVYSRLWGLRVVRIPYWDVMIW